MARKDIDTHALGTSISWRFSSFKERVIIYTMYNGSRLRSKKIIAIQSCDGCDYLRRDLKGIELLRGGRGIFFFFLDESEHKRFLSPRASPLSKILHILQLESIYIYTCVNVCACMCMEIGRGEGERGVGEGWGSIDGGNHFFLKR